MEIFVLDRVPGATETVAWTSICHRKEPHVVIFYDRTYEKSRWVHEPRKRPFAVCVCAPGRMGLFEPRSRHATYAAAMRAARAITA